jgi:hypothetical protein
MANLDQLLATVDQPGQWTGLDGIFPNLRAALLNAARIVGRSPYPLRGPGDVEIDRVLMFGLWKRLGIVQSSA